MSQMCSSPRATPVGGQGGLGGPKRNREEYTVELCEAAQFADQLQESKDVTINSMVFISRNSCYNSFALVKIADLPKWFGILVLWKVMQENKVMQETEEKQEKEEEQVWRRPLGSLQVFIDPVRMQKLWIEVAEDIKLTSNTELLMYMHEAMEIGHRDTFGNAEESQANNTDQDFEDYSYKAIEAIRQKMTIESL